MRFAGCIRRYVQETAASIPIMTALLFIPMTLMAGGAVDLVQHERIRVALQDALDRGTLAAASLTQTGNPKQVVESYLATVPGMDAYELDVGIDSKTNYRRITAEANVIFKPTFLQLAGIQELGVVANSVAQDERQNIEVSLILDISGSMVDNKGMPELRPAAKSFVDALIRPDTAAFTSMSVIPFAGQVNVGEKIFSYLTGSNYAYRRHYKSSCFEMTTNDYAGGMPVFSDRDQVPHFTYYNYNKSDREPWWCPPESQAITYITNDVSLLKARIDALKPYDGTGTAYAMRWAEMLLDPAMRPTMSAARQQGLAPIPSEFASRPAAFNDMETQKFIVLFTDGAVGFQPRPSKKSTNEVLDKNISSDNTILYDASKAVKYYKDSCSHAKGKGITIFTIAFHVTNSTDKKNLSDCATDPSYAYNIELISMASTFQSIATTIQKIRLVQ